MKDRYEKSLLSVSYLFNKKFAHMTLLGFSAGLPLYLIFSSLSLWLDQVGVEKTSITLFSWAALGYSFKFLWAPLVDKIPVFVLSKLFGQRRAWLIAAQVFIILSIIWMSTINPALGGSQIKMMAYAAVLLGFSSATQDILIDAWRIEASDKRDIAILSSLYIIGYRVGMITSGAGTLFLAHYFGTSIDTYNYKAWQSSYLIMAAAMMVGLVTTLYIKEPIKNNIDSNYSKQDYLAILIIFVISIVSFISIYQFSGELKIATIEALKGSIRNTVMIGFLVSLIQFTLALFIAIYFGRLVYRMEFVNKNMIDKVYIEPFLNLYDNHKKYTLLIIGIIATYRISDIVMGVSANLFYQYMGFSLNEIAKIVKTFGLIMTLLGGVVGGVLVVKYGVLRIMLLGAVLSAITNLLFALMAETGKSIEFLVVIISADNLSAGLAMSAFIGFLSLLVNKSYTAVQYAMFSSIMTLFPKILGGFSGGLVDHFGFSKFFLFSALIGIPVILMIINAINKNCFKFET